MLSSRARKELLLDAGSAACCKAGTRLASSRASAAALGTPAAAKASSGAVALRIGAERFGGRELGLIRRAAFDRGAQRLGGDRQPRRAIVGRRRSRA